MATGDGMRKLNEMQEQLARLQKTQDERAAAMEKKIEDLKAVLAAKRDAKKDSEEDFWGENDEDEDEDAGE